MLKEFVNARQHPNEPRRRVFSDDYFDLYVWYGEREAIVGMQLCYEYQDRGRALTYLNGAYSHHGIDSGDASPLKNLSPLLVADGTFQKDVIAEKFLGESAQLPQAVADYVLTAIRGYSTGSKR
jgi:hypothetical protein